VLLNAATQVIPIGNVPGVCAIIYEKTDDALFFLLFRRASNWKGWESVKGKMNDGETPDDAIKRIVGERIKRFTIQGPLERKRVFPVGDATHEYTIYLVESFTNIPVNMKEEKKKHDNYIWLARKEALERLHWPEEREAYEEAVDRIDGKESTI
jgi:ADP-ribose pyrophosphatase YjhB (NUDIX family)